MKEIFPPTIQPKVAEVHTDDKSITYPIFLNINPCCASFPWFEESFFMDHDKPYGNI